MKSVLRACVLVVVLTAACTSATVPPERATPPIPEPTAIRDVTFPPPVNGPTVTPTPGPTPPPPAALGAAPAVGTIVIRDGFGTLYRYDGAAGSVERLTALSSWIVARETGAGAYELGLQGGGVFVPWSGDPTPIACDGVILAIATTGTCLSRSFGADGGVFVSADGRGRLLLPPDWGAAMGQWDRGGRQLAVARITDTRCMRCPSTLWVIGSDGTPREAYDPCCADPDRGRTVSGIAWAPDGRSIAVSVTTGCAGCQGAAGAGLAVVDVGTGAVTGLGPTPVAVGSSAWSVTGMLAFVRGTQNTPTTNVLELRDAEGAVRPLDPGGYSPTWDASGGRLGWATADGTAVVLDIATGAREIAGCGGQRVSALRFDAEGTGLLLVCSPGVAPYELAELHYSSGGRDLPLLRYWRNVGPFYASDLSLEIAWSRGARP